MSKGSKNNRIKDWKKYWAEFDLIFKKKEKEIDNLTEKCEIDCDEERATERKAKIQ